VLVGLAIFSSSGFISIFKTLNTTGMLEYIATISETRNKLKDSKELTYYLMFYIGVNTQKRSTAGVAVLVNKTCGNKIHNYNVNS
jgi:hypothetical protein